MIVEWSLSRLILILLMVCEEAHTAVNVFAVVYFKDFTSGSNVLSGGKVYQELESSREKISQFPPRK